MNKPELVNTLSKETGLTKKESQNVLDTIIAILADGMDKDEEVNFAPLGKFKKVRRVARKSRNPQTGEEIYVPAKNVPKFFPSQSLKQYII